MLSILRIFQELQPLQILQLLQKLLQIIQKKIQKNVIKKEMEGNSIRIHNIS